MSIFDWLSSTELIFYWLLYCSYDIILILWIDFVYILDWLSSTDLVFIGCYTALMMLSLW